MEIDGLKTYEKNDFHKENTHFSIYSTIGKQIDKFGCRTDTSKRQKQGRKRQKCLSLFFKPAWMTITSIGYFAKFHVILLPKKKIELEKESRVSIEHCFRKR